jgi:hypothetical protein
MQRPFAPIVRIVFILLTLIFSGTRCDCETRQLSADSRPARRAAADPTSAARRPLLLPSNVGLWGVVIQQRDARV